MVAVAICILSHLLIAVRWRHGTNIWESLYVFPAGLGFGMALLTQFIGLTASAPESQLATAVSVYYLSQQVGIITGVSSSAAILRINFHRALVRQLGNLAGKDQVSSLLSSSPSICSPASIIFNNSGTQQNTTVTYADLLHLASHTDYQKHTQRL